ncbi:MAG: DegT/DnrJ/EryC1/StrS family aminotransferase [Terasakiella sp.]|uniref:DegT/DnrJ/EryC1/StrS family aminotransferase n=1 Tax=unclassified Terasakiella TaxID=2614952 RepID=UPI003B00C209
MSQPSIPFIDLKAQRDRIRDKVDAAIAKVIDHGAFIMGPEVGEFESKLTDFTGADHVLSCANGTDALQLVLMAEGVGPGDAVFVPAMTFVATAEVVPLLGATPFFVDVLPDTFNMDPNSLKQAVLDARAQGLTPKIVIPVDLFGQPADYDQINPIAAENDMIVVADSAQGLGGSLNGVRVGKLATWTTTSFFPAKPLGCYGDGGAVMTDDPERAAVIKSLRVHGKGGDKYDNVRVGINSRLDTLQAAILIEKLAIFEDELKARDRIAQRYSEKLNAHIQTPRVMQKATSSWAQYTLVSEGRDQLQTSLKEQGVPSVFYYPIALNQQTGYAAYPCCQQGVGVSEKLAKSVISLPMHPYLEEETQDMIIEAVIKSL